MSVPKTRCKRCHNPREVNKNGHCVSCAHIVANEIKRAKRAQPEPPPPVVGHSSIVLDTTLLTLDKVFAIVQAASNAGAVGSMVPLGAHEILEKICDPTSNMSMGKTPTDPTWPPTPPPRPIPERCDVCQHDGVSKSFCASCPFEQRAENRGDAMQSPTNPEAE